MANTTNFGWETPDDTDLVKDGAAAIRTLAGAIDTSLVDLKGGTTGQVLAKNSNTDMDFVWSADASGIPATIFDAKGDIIAASAADTAARLAVGANDTVLTADSSTATGLKWATPSAGGMTLLSTTALNGVSTVTISSISQAYTDLYVICRYVYFPTGGSQLYINPNATNNISNGAIVSSTGATQTGDAYQNGSIRAQAQSSATDPYNQFILKISNYTEIYYRKAFEFYGYFIQSGGSAKCSFMSGGGINIDDAITSIEVTNSVPRNFGNGGEVLIYGVK